MSLASHKPVAYLVAFIVGVMLVAVPLFAFGGLGPGGEAVVGRTSEPGAPSAATQPPTIGEGTNSAIGGETGQDTGGYGEVSAGIGFTREAEEGYEAFLAAQMLGVGPFLGPQIAVGVVEPLMTVAVAESSLVAEKGMVMGTNVQVSGVDELDLADFDGIAIAVVSARDGGRDAVRYAFVAGDRAGETGVVYPSGSRVEGISIHGGVLVVVSAKPGSVLTADSSGDLTEALARVVIEAWRLDDGSKLYEVEVPGTFLDARLLEGTLVLVTVVYGPLTPEGIEDIDVEGPMAGHAIITSIDIDSGSLESLAIEVYSPTHIYLSRDGLLVIADRTYDPIPLIRLMAESLSKSESSEARRAGSEAISLLAEGKASEALGRVREGLNYLGADAQKIVLDISPMVDPRDVVYTRLHVLVVAGLKISYLGAADIPGAVLDQFALEAMDGYLVATTTVYGVRFNISIIYPDVEPVGREVTIVWGGEEREVTVEPRAGNAAEGGGFIPKGAAIYPVWEPLWSAVYTIDLTTLSVAGSLEEITPGMRVYAARLMGDVLYMVTYRNVDPVIAISLEDPTKPEMIDVLKIEGFSEYLHPVGEDLLLGVGFDESGRLKVSLYQRHGLELKELDKAVVEGAYTPVTDDYRAFAYDTQEGRAFIPLNMGMTITELGWTPLRAVLVVEVGESGFRSVDVIDHPAIRVYADSQRLYLVDECIITVLDRATLEPLDEISLGCPETSA